MDKKIEFVLSIAGSDSSGGAGIQSDIKTFLNHGVYGLTAITSITAQNTLGVQDSYELPAGVVKSQLESILNDFKVKVVKTGMLSSDKIIKAVCSVLRNNRGIKLIADPVIYSKNRYELLNKKGIKMLKSELLPISFLVTPNLYEAEILSDMRIRTHKHIEAASRSILGLGCKNVLIKGGHFSERMGIGKGTDVLYNGKKFYLFQSKFVNTKNTHGIGCTFSSAIASNIALGYALKEAIIKAKTYLISSLEISKKIGGGYGPVEQN